MGDTQGHKCQEIRGGVSPLMQPCLVPSSVFSSLPVVGSRVPSLRNKSVSGQEEKVFVALSIASPPRPKTLNWPQGGAKHQAFT